MRHDVYGLLLLSVLLSVCLECLERRLERVYSDKEEKGKKTDSDIT